MAFALKTALAGRASARIAGTDRARQRQQRRCSSSSTQAFLRAGDDAVYSQLRVRRAYARHAGAVRVGIEVAGEGSWPRPRRDARAPITPRTRIAFIASPNNPTGTWLARVAAVESFIASVPQDVIVVLDEAYNEYLEPSEQSAMRSQWLTRFPNLIVSRTFSKAYGLAALRRRLRRHGSGAVADLMNRVRQPFNVNALAQAAAVAALDGHRVCRREPTAESPKACASSSRPRRARPSATCARTATSC